jgi:hypothetical protein
MGGISKIQHDMTGARTCPAVPAEVVASCEEPLPYRSAPDWMEDQPVPPFETPRMPEMSLVRDMSEVETAPAVALRKPERLAMESEPVVRFVLLAYAVEKPVEDAYERLVCPLNVFVLVKVFAVYVFGMVVEELMYELTLVLKLETWELVMAKIMVMMVLEVKEKVNDL